MSKNKPVVLVTRKLPALVEARASRDYQARLNPDDKAYNADELLPNCNALSIHCPATPETHHVLDAGRIALLPDKAIVVNTSRGSAIDDKALVAALASGKAAAAGLNAWFAGRTPRDRVA